MSISPAAKDTEMGYRGFATIEGFKGRLLRYSNRGGEVESVEETGEGFTPESSREMCIR
jgi:hypothetical protein